MTVEKKFVEKKISRGVGGGRVEAIPGLTLFWISKAVPVMVKSGIRNRVLNWTITITITIIVKCI